MSAAATVHACPPDGSGLTPCCERTPFELPRDDRMTSESENVSCAGVRTPEAWTLNHQVHVFAQTESRHGPLTAGGDRWMERQPTGKVMVVCSCGYSSGLVARTEMPSNDDLREHHHPRI